MKTKIFLFVVLLAGAYAGFVQYTGSAAYVQSAVDTLNRTGSMTTEELQAACEAMPRFAHVGGLTDGAFVPFGGRTYYYRSSCFMELARRTKDVTVCEKVTQRYALLQDGSGTSPAACRRTVEEAAAAAKTQDEAAATSASTKAALMEDAATLQDLSIMQIDGGKWIVRGVLVGALAGTYELELRNIGAKNDDPALVLTRRRTAYTLQPDGSFSDVLMAEVTLAQLEACQRCPKTGKRIYPIVLVLSLVETDTPPEGATLPLITSTLNATISVQ